MKKDHMHLHGILRIIQAYDDERESYILKLKAENEELKKQVDELTNLIMKGEAIREKVIIDLIVSGALDKPNKNDTEPK